MVECHGGGGVGVGVGWGGVRVQRCKVGRGHTTTSPTNPRTQNSNLPAIKPPPALTSQAS